MAPWSNGWGTEVVFGGKKMGWKLVKLEIDRYAGQLSRNFLWTLSVKLVYLFLEYLLFFCALNKRGKLFAFSNQPNFFYFANTSMGSFPRVVPVADILPYCSSTQSTFYLWSDRVCSGGIWKRDQIYQRSKYLFIHN